MYFRLTKEFHCTSEDEKGFSRPSNGGKGRKGYHLIFAFEVSSNGKRSGKKSQSERRDAVERKERTDDSYERKHVCFVCGKSRSHSFHKLYPIRSDRDLIQSLCRRCRRDRKLRIEERAQNGARQCGRITRLQVHVDDKQWCAKCGVLRSNRYHEMYKSGRLPPFSEYCGNCTAIDVQRGRQKLVRLYLETLDQERVMRFQYDLDRSDGSHCGTSTAQRSHLLESKTEFVQGQARSITPSATTTSLPSNSCIWDNLAQYEEVKVRVRLSEFEEERDIRSPVKDDQQKSLCSFSNTSNIVSKKPENNGHEHMSTLRNYHTDLEGTCNHTNKKRNKIQDTSHSKQATKEHKLDASSAKPLDNDYNRSDRCYSEKASTVAELELHQEQVLKLPGEFLDRNEIAYAPVKGSQKKEDQRDTLPPKSRAQPQIGPESKDRPKHATNPKPKVMGLSDMYWASEQGKAEKAFIEAGGLQFAYSSFPSMQAFTADNETGSYDLYGQYNNERSVWTTYDTTCMPDSHLNSDSYCNKDLNPELDDGETRRSKRKQRKPKGKKDKRVSREEEQEKLNFFFKNKINEESEYEPPRCWTSSDDDFSNSAPNAAPIPADTIGTGSSSYYYPHPEDDFAFSQYYYYYHQYYATDGGHYNHNNATLAAGATGFSSAAASSPTYYATYGFDGDAGKEAADLQDRIWEITSDEEDEIERARANLLAHKARPSIS
ncbi:uncharacterized protein CTHT_0009660 [Thermochaetoides thermophila DSM 1495]|uniref:Uncharacterized protein n=1 Tax=Chaetomium thermophilum (strain DSM 1495 / CBS 144.50 / IMI 039719) TaxID=759272 RepID=G0S0D8_CHATD|nr:hypothetical protein CTHT_0009660 [Thermochaetoides thermophila DSM 1495]EGS23299.1 hypothetical protein CTHT_0009660 [Thermochaetoides thermophila DSM 1495]